jgi:short-subunit dehydrogenase
VRFNQQVIWITGSSSGIGAALATGFAREGARLILSSRRAEELERIRLTCERPTEHLVLPLDLAHSDTFPIAVAQATAHCGPIDLLINNAGVSQRGPAMETSTDVERALMEVNYFGPVALTKAVLPAMRARRSGHIVVVSSVMGFVGTPGRSTYAAAKHALHGYFDSLRAEVWHDHISVTLACPGYVRTAIAHHALGPQGMKFGETTARNPRGIPAERCAHAIINAVARRREEVYIGGKEIAGIYLKRFVPGLFSLLVRRLKFSGDGRS